MKRNNFKADYGSMSMRDFQGHNLPHFSGNGVPNAGHPIGSSEGHASENYIIRGSKILFPTFPKQHLIFRGKNAENLVSYVL